MYYYSPACFGCFCGHPQHALQ